MLSRRSRLSFLLVIALLILAVQPSVHGAVSVAITPDSQVVPQFGSVTYAISLPGAAYPGSPYLLAISGLGVEFPLSPNPVTPPSTSTLTIDLSNSYACPGVYPFTVTATNATTHGVNPIDSGSGTATLTVVQYGPPLQVTVTTDKQAYHVGDTVTIQLTANRPTNNGLLTITPPTGPPTTIYVPEYGYSFGYSITKTYPVSQVGHYIVSFQADDYCSGFSSSTADFDVSPNTYTVSISLGGVPAQVAANIQVDGQAQGTMSGTDIKSLSFALNTSHNITVDQYIPGETGVRYYAAQNSWSVSSGGSHTYSYETQYLFTVASDPASVTQLTGGGWLSSGASAQTSQAPDNVSGPPGTQYVFKGWTVDGVLQNGNPISLTMDKPHNVVATYQTQYQLVVDSQYGDPKGSGYYPAGSTATFSVTSPFGLLIQQVFTGWNGDFTGTSATGSIIMNKPNTIHANWMTSYLQLYILIGVIAAVVVVAGFLFWRRRNSMGPPETKPTPPATGEAGGQPQGAVGETMKCSSCGTDVPVGQTYCQNCGSKVA